MATSLVHSLRLVFSVCVVLSVVATATCLPHSSEELSLPFPLLKRHYQVVTAQNGSIYVADPVTQQPVPQGSASDGGGYGFDVPAIIWLAWSFAVGTPLMLAGIRLSRATTGAAIGIVCTLLSEYFSGFTALSRADRSLFQSGLRLSTP